MQDYPYAYFFNPTQALDYVICLKSCPYWDLNGVMPTTLGACYMGTNGSTMTGTGSTGHIECNKNLYELNISDPLVLYNTVIADTKNVKVYRTKPFIRRFCLPVAVNEASRTFYQKVVSNTSADDKMDEYFSDLRNTYVIILISFGFAFLLALFYLFILRWCTGLFVWSTILLFLGLVLALGILCHVKSKNYEDQDTSSVSNNTSNYTSKTLYWFAVALYIIFGLCLCAICCYFKTIELAIAVLKSAALFVREHFTITFVPVIFALVMFGYAMFGMFVLLFLWSIGEYKKRANLPLGAVNWDTNTRRLIWVHFYTMILNICILLYWGQFMIVCSASFWYFNQGEGESGYPNPVRMALWWSIRYHFGSIVFAAFLLSWIIMVKLILQYIQYQAERVSKKNPSAKLIRCLLCIMMCMVNCFERIVKFISKTGLTMVAITGRHFCASCREGFYLILRHPLKFGLVCVLGEVFVFLGKIFIALITTFCGYLVITNYSYYVEVLYSPVIPCIFFFIIGLLVGSIFMAVYGLAADSIMLSYFVDKELVEKQGKPVHRVPAPLKDFFEEHKTDSGDSDGDGDPNTKKGSPAPAPATAQPAKKA